MTTSTETTAEGIGEVLRQTREQKGLSVQSVATSLNLKAAVIEHIEAERWDLLGVNPTFIRGYLRAYARYLKLPERELLQAFELQTAFMRQHEQAMHSFSNRTSRVAAERRFMWASYFLGVLLIGLFLVSFWQTHLLDSKPFGLSGELSVSETSTMPSQTELVAPSSDTTHSSNSQGLNNTRLTSSTDAVADSGLTAAEPSNNSQLAETDDVGSTPQAQDTTTLTATLQASAKAESIRQPEPATSSATTAVAPKSVATDHKPLDATVQRAVPIEASTGAPTDAATASDSHVQLELSFTDDCWLEIYDAKQQRMAYGMQKAGQQLRLAGAGPLSLKIGNAAATTLSVNNKAYDLSGFSKGRVARLTLTGTE